MFIITDLNDEGKFGILDDSDNVKIYCSKRIVRILEEIYKLELKDREKFADYIDSDEEFVPKNEEKFDEWEDTEEEEWSSIESNDFDEFNSDTGVEVPVLNYDDDEKEEDESEGFATPYSFDANSVETEISTNIDANKPIEFDNLEAEKIKELVKSCTITYQTKFKDLTKVKIVNQDVYGHCSDLYYIDTEKNVFIFNLHKYTDDNQFGVPMYSCGYIDKHLKVFREMYASECPFFFAYENDYVLLVKRDIRFVINRININNCKARIVGSPIKLEKAITYLMPTDKPNYYIILIVSNKRGAIGFLLFIDMTLKCLYYPYKVDSVEAQIWLDTNVYRRGIVSAKIINIKKLSISRKIKLAFTTDIDTNNKEALMLSFGGDISSTRCTIGGY